MERKIRLCIDAIPVAEGTVMESELDYDGEISIRLRPTEIALRDNYYNQVTCIDIQIKGLEMTGTE